MTVFLQFSNKNDGIANVAGQNDHFCFVTCTNNKKKQKHMLEISLIIDN